MGKYKVGKLYRKRIIVGDKSNDPNEIHIDELSSGNEGGGLQIKYYKALDDYMGRMAVLELGSLGGIEIIWEDVDGTVRCESAGSYIMNLNKDAPQDDQRYLGAKAMALMDKDLTTMVEGEWRNQNFVETVNNFPEGYLAQITEEEFYNLV